MPDQVHDAYYRLSDTHAQITAFVFDTVRATVPRMNLDDVFVSKVEIAGAVKAELSKAMSSFGYTILQALVTDIDPESKVKAAMNEINAAQRLRQAAYEQAEAQKIRVVKAAEADAESKYLQGQGIARQRRARAGSSAAPCLWPLLRLCGPAAASVWACCWVWVGPCRADKRVPRAAGARRQAIVNGLRDSVMQFSDQVQGVNSRDVLELMLMTQVRPAC